MARRKPRSVPSSRSRSSGASTRASRSTTRRKRPARIAPAKAEAPARHPALWGEVRGIALFGVALFAELALWSYDPGDRWWRFPEPVHNRCGPVGAVLAATLIAPLGWTSHLLPAAAIGIGWRSLRRAPTHLGLFRVAAFALLAVALCGVLQGLHVTWPGLLPESAGGAVGALAHARLERFFQGTGALLVLGLAVAVSGPLVLDLTLGEVLTRMRGGIATLREERAARRALRAAAAEEAAPLILDPEPELEDEDDPPPEATKPRVDPEVVEQRALPRARSAKPPKPRRSGAAFTLPDAEQLLTESARAEQPFNREILIDNSRVLEAKLANFGVTGQVVKVHPGPVITMYEFKPADGIKVSRIVSLSEDLALALRALSVRIVAPIPGKSVVGVEVPNESRDTVALRDLLIHPSYAESPSPLTLALGKDIFGTPITADLTRMPHLLVAGATGSGKSVFLNAVLCSLFFKATPDEVKLLLVDPKMLEFSNFQGIPHLIAEVVTNPKRAAAALLGIVGKMEERYKLMSERGVRNISQYNRWVRQAREKGTTSEETLPYIVVVIDELADLMIVAARDVEESLMRLAQMARAAGIHLVLATQRPSVDVLTGVIKANFPARIAFQVSSRTDSRTVLDANGAERLLGEGDSLFVPPGTSKMQRLHAPYVSEEEVQRVVEHLRSQGAPELDPTLVRLSEESERREERGEEYDELFDEAVDVVARHRIASISFVQRKLRIGYNRAARLVEQMENEGVIGPQEGTKPREIYVRPQED